MTGIGTLQRQQFPLGVMAQIICAYDNVKGTGVERFAVLSHLLLARTNGHLDPPQEMDGPTIPNPYGHGFGFPDLGLFSSLQATIESVVPVSKAALQT